MTRPLDHYKQPKIIQWLQFGGTRTYRRVVGPIIDAWYPKQKVNDCYYICGENISMQLQYRKLHITTFRNYFCVLQHCFFVSPREKWQRTYHWAWASCYESFSRKAVKRCTVMHLCHRVCLCVCVMAVAWRWKNMVFKTYKCHFQLKRSDHTDKYI